MKKSRKYVWVRNYHYETHNENNELISDMSLEEWITKVETELMSLYDVGQLLSLAYICHDKDTEDDGSLKTPHIHIIAEWKNPMSYESIFDKTGLSDGQAKNFDNIRNSQGQYKYLLHITDEAISKGKTLYWLIDLNVFDENKKKLSFNEVRDFYREKVKGNVTKTKDGINVSEYLPLVVNALYNNEIVIDDVAKFLENLVIETYGESYYLARKKEIDVDIVNLIVNFDKKLSKAQDKGIENKWNSMVLNKNRNLKNLFISGPSKIGKSMFATDLAEFIIEKDNLAFKVPYLAPTEDDKSVRYDFVDNNYKGQEITIINDVMPYRFGFKKFCGVFELDTPSNATSRFNNKKFISTYCLFTYTVSLQEYVDYIVKLDPEYNSSNPYSSYKQILRRMPYELSIADKGVSLIRYEVNDSRVNMITQYCVYSRSFDNIKEFYKPEVRREIMEQVYDNLKLCQ